VRELTLDDPIDLPADTALIIVTGCWGCDGPATGLARVFHSASGVMLTETLLTVESLGLPPHEGEWKEHYITGLAAREDGSEIVVSVCPSGYCGGLGFPTPDAREALYRSTDGGVTWRLMADAAGGQVVGIVASGTVLMAEYREQGARYFMLPGNEPVEAPVAGAWPNVLATGEITWNTEGGEILRAEGTAIFSAGGIGRQISVGGPEIAPDGTLYVYVTQNPHNAASVSYLAELDASGLPVGAFRLPEYLSFGAWRSTTPSFIGNVSVPAEQIMASPAPGILLYVPAVFDLRAATISPIPSAIAHRFGRNHVVAAQTGPFARVVNTGSCLNIRGAPSLDSNVITCAADGVLLRDQGETAEVGDGVAWVRVTTPSGAAGWAAAVYLER
jgi:hypothetical protein